MSSTSDEEFREQEAFNRGRTEGRQEAAAEKERTLSVIREALGHAHDRIMHLSAALNEIREIQREIDAHASSKSASINQALDRLTAALKAERKEEPKPLLVQR